MDNNANKCRALKLFDSSFVVGRTVFSINHRYPLLRPYGVDRWIINLSISGRARINRGHYEFKVNRGHLLLFPPGVIHDYSAVDGDDWIHLWCYFDPRPEWLRLLQWPEAALGVRKLYSGDEDFTARLESIFCKMLKFYNVRGNHYLDFCANAMEELLLWADTINTVSSLQHNDRVDRCRAFMVSNIRHPLKIADLAAYCYMSPSRFAHWFKEAVGVAPMRYLELLRLEKARELLSCTGMSIAAVADAAGYSDPLYFSRVFQHHNGVSPRFFRKRLERT